MTVTGPMTDHGIGIGMHSQVGMVARDPPGIRVTDTVTRHMTGRGTGTDTGNQVGTAAQEPPETEADRIAEIGAMSHQGTAIVLLSQTRVVEPALVTRHASPHGGLVIFVAK